MPEQQRTSREADQGWLDYQFDEATTSLNRSLVLRWLHWRLWLHEWYQSHPGIQETIGIMLVVLLVAASIVLLALGLALFVDHFLPTTQPR